MYYHPTKFLPTNFDRFLIEATMEGWHLSINWTEFDGGDHVHCYAEYSVTKEGLTLIKGDAYPEIMKLSKLLAPKYMV